MDSGSHSTPTPAQNVSAFPVYDIVYGYGCLYTTYVQGIWSRVYNTNCSTLCLAKCYHPGNDSNSKIFQEGQEVSMPSYCDPFGQYSSNSTPSTTHRCTNGRWHEPYFDPCTTCNISRLDTPTGIVVVKFHGMIFQVGDKVRLRCEEKGKAKKGRRKYKATCKKEGVWELSGLAKKSCRKWFLRICEGPQLADIRFNNCSVDMFYSRLDEIWNMTQLADTCKLDEFWLVVKLMCRPLIRKMR